MYVYKIRRKFKTTELHNFNLLPRKLRLCWFALPVRCVNIPMDLVITKHLMDCETWPRNSGDVNILTVGSYMLCSCVLGFIILATFWGHIRMGTSLWQWERMATFVVLPHWENWLDIPLSHIILTANQSLPYPINAEHQARYWQLSILEVINLRWLAFELLTSRMGSLRCFQFGHHVRCDSKSFLCRASPNFHKINSLDTNKLLHYTLAPWPCAAGRIWLHSYVMYKVWCEYKGSSGNYMSGGATTEHNP